MKFCLHLLFASLLSWPLLSPGQAGYYYVDSGCDGCKPGRNSRTGRYWMISDETHPFTMGGSEREQTLIVADYKVELAAAYPGYPALVSNVSVHQMASRDEAERSRQQRIAEMKKKGYTVVECPFWFLSHRGVPEVDRYLSYAERLGFDGVALVAENDWVIHRRGYGLARERGELAHTPNIIFPIGELTQVFTAQAIFLLREAGRLDLSDNLGNIFRDAPVDKRTITIKQLLSHTAGLPFEVPTGRSAASADVLDAILGAKLLSSPGEKYHYSEAGYQLLALIIQKITRQPYDQFLQEQIVEPFKLQHTGFLHRPPDSTLVADSWIDGAVQSFRPLQTASYAYLGSRGILTSAEDLFRWFRTLSKLPFFPEMARYQDGKDQANGLLVTAEGKIIGAGHSEGKHVQMTFDRTRNRLIVLFCNSGVAAPGAYTTTLSTRIEDILEGKKWKIKAAPALMTDQWIGLYAAEEDTLQILLERHRLKLRFSGQRLLEAIAADGATAVQPVVKEKAGHFYAALCQRDWSVVKELAAPTPVDTLLHDLAAGEAQSGHPLKVLYRGTFAIPGVGSRSLFHFYFGAKSLKYQLAWDEERIGEIARATGLSSWWEGYALPATDMELSYVDLLTGQEQTLRFSADRQSVQVGELVMQRVEGF